MANVPETMLSKSLASRSNRILWVACTALFGFGQLPIRAQFTLTINPVQLIPSSGGGLAISASTWANFQRATEQIWAQAGITVNWTNDPNHQYLTPPTQVVNSTFYNGSQFFGANQVDRMFTGDPEQFGQPAASVGRNDTPKIVDVWIIGTLVSPDGNVVGYSQTNGDGVVVTESVITNGLLGTIAHELGHNLMGAGHTSGTFDLMNAASVAPPGGLSGVVPGGTYFTLSASQITTARASSLLVAVPEPQHVSLIAAVALFGWCVWQRRPKT